MRNIKLKLILAALMSLPALVGAQGTDGDDKPSQLGVFYGYVLPNGLDDNDEIFSMWTGRYSTPMGKRGNSFAEFGFSYADDEGIEWMSGFASARMDIPIETLIGIAFVGLDFTNFTGAGEDGSSVGGHVGGGIMTLIGGDSYFRFNMKLNSRPGTSLLFEVGLVFPLGGDAAEDAQ